MQTMQQATLENLIIFRRQYYQLVEPSQLRWPEDHILKAPEAQSWIFCNLFDTEKIPTIPPDRYRLRVLKALVSKLERAMDDPEVDVRLSFLLFIQSTKQPQLDQYETRAATAIHVQGLDRSATVQAEP